MTQIKSPSSVPEVPKVKGIKVKFMFGQALTICECGNAHQAKFCRYFNRMPKIDERGRKVKNEEVFICCEKCNRMRPVKEHIADYNEVMKKFKK
jgi:hypothetical protein